MKLYPTALKLYVAESGRIRTETSVQTFTKELRSLQSRYPDQHLADFTAEQLTWFCLTRHDGKDGMPAPKTILRRRSYIMSVFDWLHRWKGVIDSNPAKDLDMSVIPGKGHVRNGTWLTEEQVTELYQSFDQSDIVERRNRLIVMFGLFTGLRSVEIRQALWKNFSPDLSQFSFVGKGDKPATVTLPPQLVDALRAWKKEAWLDATAVFPSVKVVFNRRSGVDERHLLWTTPLGEAGLRYVVQEAGSRVSHLRVNPHDLRRSLAGILKGRGMELTDIQKVLRHNDPSTTARYLAKDPARAHELADGLRFEL